MEETKERKQIIFDIHPEIHRQIKVYSAMRNISMNNWMQRAINERLEKEKRHDKENIL